MAIGAAFSEDGVDGSTNLNYNGNPPWGGGGVGGTGVAQGGYPVHLVLRISRCHLE